MANFLVLFALFAVAHSALVGCPEAGTICKLNHLIGCTEGGNPCVTANKCGSDDDVNKACGHASNKDLQGHCLRNKTCSFINAAQSVEVAYSVKVPEDDAGTITTHLASATFLKAFATAVDTPVIVNTPTCPLKLTNAGAMGAINKTDDSIVFDVGDGKLTCKDRRGTGTPSVCTLACPAQNSSVKVPSGLKCKPDSTWGVGAVGECAPTVFASVQVTAKDESDETALLSNSKPSNFEKQFKDFIVLKAAAVAAAGDVTIVHYKPTATDLVVQVDYLVHVAENAVSTAKTQLLGFDKGGFTSALDSRSVVVLAGACDKYDAPIGSDGAEGQLACSDFFINSKPCTRSCSQAEFALQKTATKHCTAADGASGKWQDGADVAGVCTKECVKTGGAPKSGEAFGADEHGIKFVIDDNQDTEGTLTCPDRFVGSDTASRKCKLTCKTGHRSKGTTRYCGSSAWEGVSGACVVEGSVAGSAKLVLRPDEHANQAQIIAGSDAAFNTKFKAAIASQIAGAGPADVLIVSVRSAPGRRLNEKVVQVDYTIRVLNQGRRA